MQAVPVGADATVYVWFWANTKARPLHLHSSRDRRLDFYAEIQILFGTVLTVDKDGTQNLILLQELPPPPLLAESFKNEPLPPVTRGKGMSLF